LLIEVPDSTENRNKTLEDVPTSFMFRGKHMQLRAVCLIVPGHFTSCVYVPGQGWIHYDGLATLSGPNSSRTYHYPFTQPKAAMRGGYIHCLLYEVFDRKVSFTVTEPPLLVQNKGLENNRTDDDQGRLSVDERLKAIQNEHGKRGSRRKRSSDNAAAASNTAQAPPPKKKQKLQKTKTKTSRAASSKSSRVAFGFTYRPCATSTMGRPPHCRGCGSTIQQDESRVIHKFIQEKRHKHPTEHQYHCKPECVNEMDIRSLDQFMDKSWSQQEMRDLVKKIDE